MPDGGPLGETFFEASERTISDALFLKRPSWGCVESVLTVRTQRLPGDFLAADFLVEGCLAADFELGLRVVRGAVRFFEDLETVREWLGMSVSAS